MIKLFENYNVGISTGEIYVSYCYPDTDITEIFLNKEDAQKSSDLSNKQIEEYSKTFTHKNKFKTITLYDAIELIKETIEENRNVGNIGDGYV